MQDTITYFSKWLNLDGYNKDYKPYFIKSLYFDSPDLRFFKEKISGDPFRDKIRIRSYEDDPLAGNIYLEIKSKQLDKIYKDRVVINHNGIESCKRKLETVGDISNGEEFVRGRYAYYKRYYNILPKVVVVYNRVSFWDTRVNFKVSIDTNISAAMPGNFWRAGGMVSSVLNDFFILELKFKKFIPVQFNEFIMGHNLQRTPFSKYVESVQVMYPEVKWLLI